MRSAAENIAIKFVRRVSGEGHPFTELLHTWMERGEQRYALSRVPYLITDGSHNHAVQIEAFKLRRQR